MTDRINSETAAPYTTVSRDIRSDEDAIIADALWILHGRLAEPEIYITSPETATQFVQLKLAERKNEVFAVLWMDNRHGVLSFEEITAGTIDGATVPPRLVVQRALEVNAAAVVLVHNHPSGNSEPSQADQRITQRLKDALGLVDIRVLDHLVVGRDVVSFAERGLI